MDIFHAIILGIIQGLTEFLPISSTAHLTVAGKLMGLIDPARPEDWTAFIAIIQLGTVSAVIIYFFRDVVGMLTHGWKDLRSPAAGAGRWSSQSRLAWKIIVGTIPVGVIGLLFKKIIEGAITKELSVIGSSMIGLALLLWWAERVGKRTRTEDQTTWKDALIIGFAQAMALIPGSSRSGTTITAGLFLGLTRETAARFSFLLSIPAVIASGLFELYSARHHFGAIGLVPVTISTIVSGVVGYATISFLLKYLKTHTTYVFILYRLVLGIALWWMFLNWSA
ncbi:MAG TPA: undecaprenyl-diphosphatase UppP [Bacteroidota bacterium]|nr:undecaprenyl-diphosphatase UppP [Bacteroidota bacterium]